jgi:hypothetical protein
MAFEVLRSPSVLMQAIFWLYLFVFIIIVTHFTQILRRREVFISHFRDIFRILTRFRIWTMRNRRTYTTLVAFGITIVFLVMVYLAERAHYFFYQQEPTFTTIPDFFLWITTLLVSAFEVGDSPESFLSVLVVGILPLFLIGSIVAIVRFTSERSHELLAERLARGDLASNRIVIFNYQANFDGFVRTILDNTEYFVTVFAAGDHYDDAEALRDSFEKTSDERYRLYVSELSYSDEVLFDEFDFLDASELYLLSDMAEDTDYRNLQLLTKINEELKHDHQMDNGLRSCPNIVWEARNTKFKHLSRELDSGRLQRNLYPVSFYEDCSRIIFSNLSSSIRSLDDHYRFGVAHDVPRWIDGYTLDNYSFTTTEIADTDRERLTEIRTRRREQSDDERVGTDEMSSLKRTFLEDIEHRVESNQSEDGQRLFYGLLTDVAGSKIQLDPSAAFFSQQIETTERSIQIETAGDAATGDWTLNPPGDIFVINLNSYAIHFLRTLDERLGDCVTDPPAVTVFSQTQSIESDFTYPLEFVEYDDIADIIDHLFTAKADEGHCLETGDSLLLFLDHDLETPNINSMKILDYLDERLDTDDDELGHNDVFLGVESHTDGHNKIYEYLSVDKTIDTFRPRKSFFDTLVQLRNDETVQALVREGQLESTDAFEWAVESANYFRPYVVQPATDIDRSDTLGEPVVGENHLDTISQLRQFEQRSRQLFTSFRIARPTESAVNPTVSLLELTSKKSIDEDEYLLFLPYL